MKATWSWIREFVDIQMDPLELSDRLTNVGLECKASIQGELPGVVVGEILEVGPHPHSPGLRLCRVQSGQGVLSVVCGAPNVREGIKVPLALPGATLPGGREIQVAEIKGVPSQGMLCSEAELETGDDSSGLWVLPPETPVGRRIDEAMGLRDWVFEFDLTPNRADCLSISGLAYEVAAITGSKVRPPALSLEEEGPRIEDLFRVYIQDPDLCPRYVARLVLGTKSARSPLWMRRRLQLVGMRPISNIVDVTNYVMWELGQPLHAFDMDLLEGGCIVVKRARPEERFVSLDGRERVLSQEMLMIWDGLKPVAVAGVMGGANSEVGPDTERVLIESACFDPINTRRTAKALGMLTEASRRFERGVDIEGCAAAADRAAGLMRDLAGGRVAVGRIDEYPGRRARRAISLRVAKVNELLGTDLEGEEVKAQLERLDLQVRKRGDGILEVLPPTRRVDLTREVDLVEEVARIWGFDKVPCTVPRTSRLPSPPSRGLSMESFTREVLVGYGFHEVITYSFMDPSALDRLGIPSGDPLRRAVALRNPLRRDQGVMRTTLVPGILDTVRHNLSVKNSDLRLFEIGRVFLPDGEGELPREPVRLAGAMTGLLGPLHWSRRPSAADFFDLKGALEGLLDALQVPRISFREKDSPLFLEPGYRATLFSGEEAVGWMGQVAPAVAEGWELGEGVMIFELDFESLVRLGTLEHRFRPLPRFPEVTRDISIVVRREIRAGDILQEILSFGQAWLQEVCLFDVFTDPEKIPPGHKSLAFRLVYRCADRSLTDEEVNEQKFRLVEALEHKYGARLRS
jgi:phenylalanyl-tRNA synthetase beta chain